MTQPWAPEQKMDKSTVQYARGTENVRCGNCCYFQRGSCEMVAGEISAEAQCRYFESKVLG